MGFEEAEHDSGSRLNEPGAELVLQHVKRLVAAGVPPSAVGVITPYSAQVQHIGGRLAGLGLKEVEVSTVDGFQGREMEVYSPSPPPEKSPYP